MIGRSKLGTKDSQQSSRMNVITFFSTKNYDEILVYESLATHSMKQEDCSERRNCLKNSKLLN